MSRIGIPGTSGRLIDLEATTTWEFHCWHQYVDIPHEGNEEFWQVLEDGGGCSPGILHVCGKKACVLCFSRAESRSWAELSLVCDTKGVKCEGGRGLL